jgi:acetyl/propionyl-CoA carboxylase alpha subunit
MRRALSEYDVQGIKTTIPFFQWVLGDADFLAGRYDTSFIDRKLAARNGDPLHAPQAEVEDLAAMAVALHAATRASRDGTGTTAPVPGRWKDQGRAEARRG